MEKLIITAAICGAEVTKEQNSAVPYTVEELVREARSANEAGAAVIHLHVRMDDGTPTQDRERFRVAMEAIRKACPEVIILPSTGGAVGMTAEERLQPVDLVPEMATLDCGTCNFGGDDIFVNTETMVKTFAEKMNALGVKPECECFDKGMIDTAVRMADKGLLRKPLHFNLVLGVNGGISATARDLTFLVDSLPTGSTWCVTGIGRSEFPMAAVAITMGGHVRVGFEDNVYVAKGVLAASNGELVAKVVDLARLLGRDIASPAEARRILGIRTK